jgi:hypothetical protein
MKQLIFGFIIVTVTILACNTTTNESKKVGPKHSDSTSTSHLVTNTEPKNAEPGSEVVTAYLKIKNALTNDNGKVAATGGKEISEAINKIDESSITAEQKKVFDAIKDDIQEHGEHISLNSSKIAHQREHFDMLSEDIYSFVKTFGSSQTLYKDNCPMYSDGQGADWLSEVKEIKNPYLGKKMITCGSIKEEIRPLSK